MSVKNHPTTETKKPKNQSSTENAGTVLFFCFFGSLFFWFFGSLVFWFFVIWVYKGTNTLAHGCFNALEIFMFHYNPMYTNIYEDMQVCIRTKN